MSKGSKPRPFSVTQEEYERRWDMIFGRDLDEKSVSTDDSVTSFEKLEGQKPAESNDKAYSQSNQVGTE